MPVVRLIRRICLLREQGEAAAAHALERTQLDAAVQAARKQLGPESLPTDELQRLFARESERAAEAVAVAELIVQQLAPQRSGVALAAGAHAGGSVRRGEPPAHVARPKAGEVPSIADMLDAMLAHERRASRP